MVLEGESSQLPVLDALTQLKKGAYAPLQIFGPA